MKFSVIIPVHNGAEYLKDAMESVLGQAHNGICDFEVVLVENGSDDDSARICDGYAADYHMVTALHRGRIGAYAARRDGMEVSAGEWLIFLDADDELVPDSLHKLGEYISGFSETKSAPDIIFYNYERMTSSGNTTRTFPFTADKVYEGDDKRAFYDVMCQGDLLNPLWNKCVKKELAMVTLQNDETIFLNHGEDLLQTAQFLDRAEKIAYIDETIYRYRCDNQGLTGKYHEEFLPNQKHAWESLLGYVNKWYLDPSKYIEMINERQVLTCCIAAKTIVMSDMKKSDVSAKLKELFADSFYREYSTGTLPKWASEEDVFFHEFQLSSNPYKEFMRYLTKRRIKNFIKKRIRK